MVWSNLVRIEYLRGHHAQVVYMQSAALGAAERIADVWLQTEIMLNVGGSLGQLGKPAEAQTLFEHAVTLRRQLYGPRDRRLAFALSALGNAYAMKGELDAGITAHREAAEIGDVALGRMHPGVGLMHGNLGSDYLFGLHPLEAITEFELHLASAEGAHGPKHRDVAIALTDLGLARLEAKQLPQALEAFTRAEATWREVNPKHPSFGDALLGKYLAQQALGQPASLADLEAANELAKGLPPFMQARQQLALGKALAGKRAVELVKASAAGFATSSLPLCQRELAVARAWLAAH
jgi:tetratricopeptide (TPR) repeat protein